MANLNKVMLIARLTRDPELRYTANNTAVCNLSVAVNHSWKNQSGEKQEEVTYVDCTAWGRTADAVNQYCHKGDPLYVEGRLRLEQWQDKEGQNRSKLGVVVDRVEFLGSKRQDEGQQQAKSQRPQPAQQNQDDPRMVAECVDPEIPF